MKKLVPVVALLAVVFGAFAFAESDPPGPNRPPDMYTGECWGFYDCRTLASNEYKKCTAKCPIADWGYCEGACRHERDDSWSWCEQTYPSCP